MNEFGRRQYRRDMRIKTTITVMAIIASLAMITFAIIGLLECSQANLMT